MPKYTIDRAFRYNSSDVKRTYQACRKVLLSQKVDRMLKDKNRKLEHGNISNTKVPCYTLGHNIYL